MLAYHLFGYGVIRFVLEYFRQPDAHIGFVFMSLSMGQILCGVMAASGVSIYYYLNSKKQ